MKRIALLLAGLVLGTTSPAMADAWTPGSQIAVAAKAAGQLAQNDDPRDRRDTRTAKDGKNGKDERGDQREARPPREAPPQREAPQRDPRDGAYDRRDMRQVQDHDPRDQAARPDRREVPPPPQAHAAPRLSEQAAIGQIMRQSPGGRLLDSNTVTRNGRTFYSVRYLTRDGQRVDFLVDAESGSTSRGGG
jgi:uncharacterized membrane protein YkoI